MRTPARTLRTVAVLAATGTLVLSGCGGQDDARGSAGTEASAAPRSAVSASGETAAAATRARPTEPDVPLENTPTVLPPGDPGLDAPSAPDPGVPHGGHEHDAQPLTVVPGEAMLDTRTVSSVLPGSWRRAAGGSLPCAATVDPVAERTAAFATAAGRLVQVVRTHDGARAADATVAEVAHALRDCGWNELADPRLGTASSALESPDGARRLVVIAAEGVTVTLAGSGAAVAQPARWAGIADLSLGTSCAAAPDGCH